MPTGYTTVSSALLTDATGALVANATISFQPSTSSGLPISFRVNGDGQSMSLPVSTNVTNGVFSLALADTTLTSPANIAYAVTVIDNVTGKSLLGPGYLIQPSGATWNFDTFIPNLSANITVQPGPVGATGAPGPANTLSIGTVATGAAGSSVIATITGTSPAQTLNLTIPQGAQGPVGGALATTTPIVASGAGSVGTATTSARGDHAHPSEVTGLAISPSSVTAATATIPSLVGNVAVSGLLTDTEIQTMSANTLNLVYCIADSSGKVAWGIRTDGTIYSPLSTGVIGLPSTAIVTTNDVALLGSIFDVEMSAMPANLQGFVRAYVDSNNQVALGIRSDGSVYIPSISPGTLTSPLTINGTQVLGAQMPAIRNTTDTSDAAVIVNQILQTMRSHGLISSVTSSSLLTGLSAYWTMNEATGNHNDSVGSSTLVLSGTPTAVPGVQHPNSGYFLSASSNTYSVASSTALQTGGADFTLAAWIYVDKTTAGSGNKYVVGKGHDYVIFYDVTNLRFGFTTYSSGENTVYSTTSGVTPGSWNLVVGWQTGGNIYIQVSGQTPAVQSATATVDSTDAFQLNQNTQHTNTAGFTYRLGPIGFWKRALTTAELASLWNSGVGRVYPFIDQDYAYWNKTTVAAADLWENGRNDPQLNFIRFTEMARFRFTTNAPQVAVEYYNNTNTSPLTAERISIVVDGVPATPLWARLGFLTDVVSVALSPGTHTVDVVNGSQLANGSSAPYGSQLVKVSVPYPYSITKIPPVTTNTLLVYGDSITSTLSASYLDKGWTILLRESGRWAGPVAIEAFGSRTFAYDMNLNASTTTAFVNNILGNYGAVTAVWVEMGINDARLGTFSNTDFQTVYGNFLDALHAKFPAAHLYAQSMLITGAEGTANSLGFYVSDYRTAVQNAASTRTGFTTFVDGSGIILTSDLGGDGLHPGDTGHNKIYLAACTALGI